MRKTYQGFKYGNCQSWGQSDDQTLAWLSPLLDSQTHQSVLLIVALDGGQHQAQQLRDVWPQALILGQAVHHLHNDVAQLVLYMREGIVSDKTFAASQGALSIHSCSFAGGKALPAHRHLLQHCTGSKLCKAKGRNVVQLVLCRREDALSMQARAAAALGLFFLKHVHSDVVKTSIMHVRGSLYTH